MLSSGSSPWGKISIEAGIDQDTTAIPGLAQKAAVSRFPLADFWQFQHQRADFVYQFASVSVRISSQSFSASCKGIGISEVEAFILFTPILGSL